jgi:hypothetical protein
MSDRVSGVVTRLVVVVPPKRADVVSSSLSKLVEAALEGRVERHLFDPMSNAVEFRVELAGGWCPELRAWAERHLLPTEADGLMITYERDGAIVSAWSLETDPVGDGPWLRLREEDVGRMAEDAATVAGDAHVRDAPLAEVVEEAEFAFWEVVARRTPSASSGDLPPDASFAFTQACRDAVERWVELNVRPAERTYAHELGARVVTVFGGRLVRGEVFERGFGPHPAVTEWYGVRAQLHALAEPTTLVLQHDRIAPDAARTSDDDGGGPPAPADPQRQRVSGYVYGTVVDVIRNVTEDRMVAQVEWDRESLEAYGDEAGHRLATRWAMDPSEWLAEDLKRPRLCYAFPDDQFVHPYRGA